MLGVFPDTYDAARSLCTRRDFDVLLACLPGGHSTTLRATKVIEALTAFNAKKLSPNHSYYYRGGCSVHGGRRSVLPHFWTFLKDYPGRKVVRPWPESLTWSDGLELLSSFLVCL